MSIEIGQKLYNKMCVYKAPQKLLSEMTLQTLKKMDETQLLYDLLTNDHFL